MLLFKFRLYELANEIINFIKLQSYFFVKEAYYPNNLTAIYQYLRNRNNLIKYISIALKYC